ncbi:MAG: hypothetical protein HWE11_06880 [Gammaproteobacteria bacterium]|nr:hypothetical protein [Gammaproteobacteria bacterium]
MDYFNRLIRRANAEYHSSRQRLYDPFENTVIETPTWPQPASSLVSEATLAAEKSADNGEQTINSVQSMLQPSASREPVSKPVAGKQNETSKTEQNQPIEQTASERIESKPVVLNDDSPYSVLDKMFAPHIAAVDAFFDSKPIESELKSKPAADAAQDIQPSATSVEPKLSPATKTQESLSSPPSSAPIHSLTPPQVQPASRLEPESTRANQSSPTVATEPSAETRTPAVQPTVVERKTEYIVVNRGAKLTLDSDDFSSGSPGLGIGHL